MNRLSPDIMNTIFKLRQYTYNLRNFHAFESQDPRTKNFDLKCIAYKVSQPWKDVPREVPLISCLYLVYLNLVEYILVPHVKRILGYKEVFSAKRALIIASVETMGHFSP